MLHVVNASWSQARTPVNVDGLLAAYSGCGEAADKVGFVVQFSQSVQVATLNIDTVLLIADADETFEKEMAGVAPVRTIRSRRIPVRIEPVQVKAELFPALPRPLIKDFQPVGVNPDAGVNGVRIFVDNPAPDWKEFWRKWLGKDNRHFRIHALTVVLRGAWILGEQDDDDRVHALDGAPIAPGVPQRPSGHGVEGNDWYSVIRINA